MKSKGKVFVGMSGGVDSSVAALLLKKKGYDVTGVFIRSYNLDGCAERDAEDARRTAEHLDIPFYVFDFEKEYKESVVDYMVLTYQNGLTPNPDVMCNKEIKFGLFLKKSLEMGADYVATGHYVIKKDNRLFAAKDKNKDQSYFLWTLTADQIAHSLFPIGGFLKSKVRRIAKRAGLPTADKKDSQGICFLGDVDLADFLKKYIPEKPGDIVNLEGEIVGRHEGIFFYTIGQRHLGTNLKIKGADKKPYYVVSKNVKTNTLVIAEGDDNPVLTKKELDLENINLIGGKIKGNRVRARVRYRQPLSEASLIIHRLVFKEPQKFVAPGQSAVFYSKKGELLGGGVIV